MFDQFLQCLKLSSCGDVVATVIKLADFVVLHIVTLQIIPVTYGERVGSCQKNNLHNTLHGASLCCNIFTYTRVYNLYRLWLTFRCLALPDQERPSLVSGNQ